MSPPESFTARRARRNRPRDRPPAAPSRQSARQEKIVGTIASIKDGDFLEAWLGTQPRETAVTMAARSALRVAPLVGTASRELAKRQLGQLTEATFRATALARAVGKYSVLANGLRAAANAAAFAAANPSRGPSALGAAWSVSAASFAADTALDATGSTDDAVLGRRAAETNIRAARAAVARGDVAAFWVEVRADADVALRDGATALADRPLWSEGTPGWAADHWTKLKAALPKNDDWEVWFDWYEERLRGGSRGEDYELVFASVPREEWDKGPLAANTWIKAHLPTAPAATRPGELPAPLPNLAAPFTYGWNEKARIEAVAGAQNLPFYPHFSSEEDHRKALEVCRVGGERLLKSVSDGRYNARKEYGEALGYYLDDLPKTAGTGNILLANDQVRILHDMFLADASMLPEGLASRLKA